MPCTHWVAVCISDSGYAEYFDSYCLPYKLEIIAFLQRHSISWRLKRHRLQGLTSNVCGRYCCIYALHRAGGQTMISLVIMFVSARYTCIGKNSSLFPRSVSRIPRLLPVGAAAVVVQSADINKCRFAYNYQSAMSLIQWLHILGRPRLWTRVQGNVSCRILH